MIRFNYQGMKRRLNMDYLLNNISINLKNKIDITSKHHSWGVRRN